MSKKNKPVLIVTSVAEDYWGKYITSGHNTSGIDIHFLFTGFIWGYNKKAYIKDFEKIFKLKYRLY
jgi:hypothetical protein